MDQRETVIKLLRAMATGTQAKESRQDVVLNEAARILEDHAREAYWEHYSPMLASSQLRYVVNNVRTGHVTKTSRKQKPFYWCMHLPGWFNRDGNCETLESAQKIVEERTAKWFEDTVGITIRLAVRCG